MFSPRQFVHTVKVGEGAFGSVFRATDSSSGAPVALKKLRLRDVRVLPVTVTREISALRRVGHPNVVPLMGTYAHGSAVVLVMPYLPYSLAGMLAACDAPLPEPLARSIARMMLCGLTAIHAADLLHRDLKPANLLISEDGVLRIADFGQARLRPVDEHASLSHAVATRWYRAPELLLGGRRYSGGVDVWAAGCVVAQLALLSPLLAGESDIDQLFRVVQLLGYPTRERWPDAETLPDFGKIELPPCEPTPLEAVLPSASATMLDLLRSMLQYHPPRRVTAADALRQPWMLQPAPQTLPLDRLLRKPPSSLLAAPAATGPAGGKPLRPPAAQFPAGSCHTMHVHLNARPSDPLDLLLTRSRAEVARLNLNF